MASSRSKVFECLPTAGLPYQLDGWSEFEEFMGTFIAAQAITSIREVWWDIRPHPDFGTVELRICDGIPTMREVASLAAMAQSLVEWMDARLDAGEKLVVPREWVVKQNKWKASRHGLDADLIVDDQGRRVPLRDAIGELVDELSPTAAGLGCLDELRPTSRCSTTGPSYRASGRSSPGAARWSTWSTRWWRSWSRAGPGRSPPRRTLATPRGDARSEGAGHPGAAAAS